MIILGDIGNTESKICLVNNNKIIKKILIPSSEKKIHILNKYFRKFDFSKIEKILFCSVVPSTFTFIRDFNFNLLTSKHFNFTFFDKNFLIKSNVLGTTLQNNIFSILFN